MVKLGDHPDGIYKLTNVLRPGGQHLQYLTPVRWSIWRQRYVPDNRRVKLLQQMQEVDAQCK